MLTIYIFAAISSDMKKSNFLSTIMLSLLVTICATSYAAMRSAGAIETELNESSFHVKIKSGFHLNEKAPNSLAIDDKVIKPQNISSQSCEFSGLPKQWSKGRASLYICDDAVTFCESHSIELKGGSSNVTKVVKAQKIKGKINSHGFIEDDLNQGVEFAKKNGKLLLVDFSARWCPGCVRFETETFNTKEFKKLTSSFVKVKIDMDRFENVVLSEKFKINAIPTLLIMNSDQLEINRLIDYQPIETVTSFFTSVKSDSTPLNILIEKSKSKNPEVDLRVGKRLVDAGRYKESLAFLERVSPVPTELQYAKVESVASEFKLNKDFKSQYIKTLQSAIDSEPSSSRSILWRTELIGLLEDKAKINKLMTEGAALADFIIADPEKLKLATKGDLIGEFTGYESFLVSINKADLVESANADPELVKLAWASAASIGKKLKITPKQSGPALRYLIVLSAANLLDDAEKFSFEMLKHDPNNGDVQRRRLKILVNQKKCDDAINLGQTAIKNSYGRNEFWVAELLAKAYLGANKNKEAKLLLEKYLSRSDVEWSNLQSSRKSLEELRKQIN